MISAQELSDRLDDDRLIVLDASLHLPATGRDAHAEYAAAHIPGARFLDLATLTDPAGSAPNAVPTRAQFAERLAQLGISAGDRVVLYDDSVLRSSARAWFVFKLHGWQDVAILDGGLRAWRSSGLPLDSGTPHWERSSLSEADLSATGASLRDKEQVRANVRSGAEQVVDARDEARFRGEEGSGSAGHIPGALNVPFTRMLDDDGRFRSGDAVRAELQAAGVDADRPIITSCNSGVTACVVLFAARMAGARQLALYDGSWVEWGNDPSTPKASGAA